jgi:hypothetical protein
MIEVPKKVILENKILKILEFYKFMTLMLFFLATWMNAKMLYFEI